MKPTGEIYTNWVLLPKELKKAGKNFFLHKLELYYDAWYRTLKHML